ncbi:penicillin-binding protein 1B [Alginatibacterium sediminis]|uniref:Penicillin-binding protein 1B n=1 Tax=Alginatibacterium sediminis TaxID=2164068 RepID=A0A420E940_9ALTE|nr:penicillin-binding protein 1B [Alginatibacterium sediminis]
MMALTFKLGLVLLAVLLLWGVYLDSKIQARFVGDKWELPAVVYGREMSLYPGLRITRAELQEELKLLNYRKVSRAKRAGEYAVSETKIELIRRSFHFADGPEQELPLLLTFSPYRLEKIVQRDSGEELAQTRLDPLLLERLNINQQQDRLFVGFEQLPATLVDTLVLTEDRRFYEHDGVAPSAILRALLVNLKAGRTVQGGSTITQQLAKNFFLSRERSLWRKIQEAYMALIIDFRFSKTEILESYINEVYLGQNGNAAVHGMGLGSYFYFGKPLQDLGPSQIAMLVGIIKGPSYYDPWRHPERISQRRDVVLRLMFENGKLEQQEYQDALDQDLGVIKRGQMAYQKVPGFVSLVRRELSNLGQDWSQYNGLRVFTTLDPISQRYAQQATSEQLKRIDKSGKLEAAMVVSERHSGAVRALVSGRDPSLIGFNRALDGLRQIGSLAKPFVFLTAYEQGHHMGELIDDNPLTLTLGDGSKWSPKNYDKKFRGPVMLHQALMNSLNVPTVRLGMQVGLKNVVKTMQAAGYDKSINPNPSLVLGSTAMSPIEVAQMYQTLGADGEYRPLFSIEQIQDGQGDTLYQQQLSSERRFDELANFLTLHNMSQVTRYGTARSLRAQYPKIDIAGKTGTTNDLRDSWFVGIDQREIATVWVGRDDNSPAGVTGSSAALPIYSAYLKRSYPQSLRALQPDNLAWIHFSKDSGRAVAANCGNTVLLPANATLKNQSESCNTSVINEPVKKAKSWFEKIFN